MPDRLEEIKREQYHLNQRGIGWDGWDWLIIEIEQSRTEIARLRTALEIQRLAVLEMADKLKAAKELVDG